jgi:hypothetical protein
VPPEVHSDRVLVTDMLVRGLNKLDLLFVFDDSPTMRAYRPRLLANLPNFIAVLGTAEGGVPSLHLAVVTADLGTSGARDGIPGSPIPGDGSCIGDGEGARFRTGEAFTGRFVVDQLLSDNSRVRNYSTPLADVFSTLADVGNAGCAFSQPLEAMRRALLDPENAGFLRDDANLAVVFVTAQDDCSFDHSTFVDGVALDPIDTSRCYTRASELVPVDTYARFLKSLRRDISRVAVSTIAGPRQPIVIDELDGRAIVEPACSYDGVPALPAPRLAELVDLFPNRGTTTNICQSDLSGGLQFFPELLGAHVGDPCINGTIADVDPETPGRQEDCAAWYSFRPVEQRDDELVGRCSKDPATPCWDLVVDPTKCPTGTSEVLTVHTGPVELPTLTHLHLECVASPSL